MRKISILTLLADLVWIPAALAISHWFHQHYGTGIGQHEPLAQYFHVVLAAALIWVALQSRITIEGSRASSHLPTMLSQVTVSSVFLLVAMLATAFMTREMLSREVMLLSGSLLFAGFITIRVVARAAVKMRAAHGGAKNAVIVGDGQVARELEAKVRRHPELMLNVVGFLSPLLNTNENANERGGLPASGNQTLSSVEVLNMLRHHRVAEVLVAQPQLPLMDLQRMIAQCRKGGMQVRVVPNFYELYLSRTLLVEVEGVPLVALLDTTFSQAARSIKRLIDLLIGGALLLVCSPVVLLSAFYLMVKRRPVFRSEPRGGKDGTVFAMYRLGIYREDPSLDYIERFLAITSVTELPQLVNVLKGEMSLVGPRPESPERVKCYSEWQKQRLNVKPGVTGLAQVHGLRERDSSDAKAYYDLEYILHWSAGGDVSLIVHTAWTLLLRIRDLRRRNTPILLSPPVALNLQASTATKQRPVVTEQAGRMAHADRA
jgi:lipopolysaccharide/colanic/teichoic acid biosynthesis glycosyltransferase